jgi:TonB family protein
MSSPYIKIGLACALFATLLGITFYATMPGEPANDYRYNGLSQSTLPPPPPAAPLVEEEVAFSAVEEMPLFPGCEDISDYEKRKSCADQKLMHYVYANVKYPKEAIEEGKHGMAVINFEINYKGEVFGAKIVRDPGAGMGEEALRVVKGMIADGIRWTPGRSQGKPVTVQFNLPVKFKLE